MIFRNDYWFLSNMYPCSIEYKGKCYSCVESAFQAQKEPGKANMFTQLTGFQAKQLGRTVRLPEGWERTKIAVMAEILVCKFKQHPELKTKLLNVTEPIQEDNSWGDTYWGVCRNQGRNVLGKILTAIREDLKHA